LPTSTFTLNLLLRHSTPGMLFRASKEMLSCSSF
jgi:hypothetical protein